MPASTRVNPLDLVVRRGIRVSRPGFTIYFKTLTGSHRPRIVISHKVDKRATVRNLLRRRIRSVIGKFLSSGVGVVVVCRPEIVTLTFAELKTKLTSALNQFPWPKSQSS